MNPLKKAMTPEQIASSLDECFCHCFKGCDDCAMTDRDPILEDCGGSLAEMAIDLIRTQEKRIAELESERRWIPVAEKLPEHCVTVLSYNGVAIGTDFYDEVFETWYSDLDRPLPMVTHWRPLPDPPQEVQHGQS